MRVFLLRLSRCLVLSIFQMRRIDPPDHQGTPASHKTRWAMKQRGAAPPPTASLPPTGRGQRVLPRVHIISALMDKYQWNRAKDLLRGLCHQYGSRCLPKKDCPVSTESPLNLPTRYDTPTKFPENHDHCQEFLFVTEQYTIVTQSNCRHVRRTRTTAVSPCSSSCPRGNLGNKACATRCSTTLLYRGCAEESKHPSMANTPFLLSRSTRTEPTDPCKLWKYCLLLS